ncbi:LCP family protein [Kitasatospora sp. MBT63]|uniref:LCP family protein n=1 Tax=Kitasatospora sp. MBT63 TaxID=1444768 RepID=UPI0006925FD9|nr:LCP family protein [Kitasatospora sp. MBT63]
MDEGTEPDGGRAAERRPAGGTRRGRRRARRSGIRRWIKPVALTTGALVVAGCGGGYLYLRHLDANLQHAPLGAGNAPPPPGQADAQGRVAMNILIIGTDSRKGLGGGYGDRDNVGAGNNDVNIVLHVYPDRRAAVALDLPRDTLIDHPKCVVNGETHAPLKHRPLNEALGHGGPGCVQDTVQSITHLKIDHYVLVNFQGVKDITDAVGGVEVNLCQPIKDKDSELDLPAGVTKLNGEQGLQFVRTRKQVQDGTAIGRFAMQRAFLASLLKKVTDQGTLLDPTKAFPVVEAATRSITVDDPIAGTLKLAELASSLHNIKPAEISFVQPPTEYTHDDPDKSLREKDRLVQPGADGLFALILADRTLNGTEDHSGGADPAASPAADPQPAAPSSPAAPPVDPGTVTVQVLNGTPQPNLAAETGKKLSGLGYRASPGTGAGTGVRTSSVRYAQADQRAGALAVAAALGLPESAVSAGGGGRGVVVTLGADYQPGGGAAAAPAPVPSAVPSDVAVHQGDEGGCVQGRTGTH